MKTHLFKEQIDKGLIPENFTFEPHPLSRLAAKDLQDYLKNQTDWVHNFGLDNQQVSPIIGKMFGVLVVKNLENEIGYLAGFSGKLADSNMFDPFVPPVFDMLEENSFLSDGMKELSLKSLKIKNLQELKDKGYEHQVQLLRKERRSFSVSLQNQLFESYHFINQAGEEKSLIDLFKKAGYKNPPAGAGECAAPKLLQYAFRHQLTPLALLEFWWGQSPKSATWKHEQYYAPCKEKCEPILAHILKGILH